MTRIGLISDTHGYLDNNIVKQFSQCQEIWHAGDFGNMGIADELMKSTGLPLKGVYGNIDGYDIRSVYPETLVWNCEEVKVYMKHIGGYPGKYAPGVKDTIKSNSVKLFISGHSHILKIMYDDKLQCLHMNPGAAGNEGWHKIRTVIRFTIDGSHIKDCDVVKLGKR